MPEEPRPSRSESGHRQIGDAVGHTVEAGAFFGSLMAGFLLGWIADHFFHTRPVFIVIGIIVGAVVGFWRMWVDYGRAG
ncbi:MAG: AtpZ/AtpI family protein [Acidimicrobiia bacterium]|nr:AtpZ/AtpI family protein [Acidimicrobiia bacterium]